ncbi:uncharacterized protein LOC115085785 [Rhinatrema bivittatum]|uniref:uncharacterized protein LOC115085785 n=1 Tax=Rhinatrema bivittatum TaxID=194408 RepID=UPI001127319C|nr:uncharacterized protein LOC115085785 [Rhinatrema bivittatum]XP_029448054.1 uncharacterized protein LOC115085785 [Rhinatrema bivittatum]
METVWVDKHKYDEAEKLHYEREAVMAATALDGVEEETLNGVSQDECCETGPNGEHKKSRNGKKQRKRRSPKPKSVVPKLNLVLAGLLADHVWFDRHAYEKAECEYQTKLAADLAKALLANKLTVPSALVPRPKNKRVTIQATINCNHSNLVACHHVIHGVWVNKTYFGDAEKKFIEQFHSLFASQPLRLPLLLHDGDPGGLIQRTPDEGYMTAMSTPATPAAPNMPSDNTIASGLVRSTRFSTSTDPTVNGKPHWSRFEELITEVWLEKPAYDDAERYFYENMFAGHSVIKGESYHCQQLQPEVMKEDIKQNATGKQSRVKGKGFADIHGELHHSSPVPCPLYKESEHLWLSKPLYKAESQYCTSTAWVTSVRRVEMGLEMQLEQTPQPAVPGHHLK